MASRVSDLSLDSENFENRVSVLDIQRLILDMYQHKT